jgi:two-component system OmpR family sensor kinase
LSLGALGLIRAPLRTPLFVQVLGLMLLSLIAAQVVNVGIVFLIPPPPPEYYSVNEVAAVLKADGEAVRVGNGHTLVASSEAEPVHVEHDIYAPREARLAENLADVLGVAPGDVRVALFTRYRGLTHPAPPLQPAAPFAGGELRPRRPMRQPDVYGSPLEFYLVAPFEAAVRQPGGRWTALKVIESGPLASWQQRILLWFGVSALCLMPVAFVFARKFARPLTEFAAAAERLGRDPTAQPVQIDGPAEVTVASAAFNQMQDRLRRYVEDRTSMVGAIAHDLRTPLTRLRFRIEAAPEPLRAKMASEIDQMDAMIAATLAFVRGATEQHERLRLELVSLVESVADEMAETGLDVKTERCDPVVIEGDPIGLRRLVTNLLDNAVKFGGGATARVYQKDGAAVLEVDDDGPGVSDADRERVFEPFYRGEPSRSRSTGGAGLGLAVVRSIARGHGGDAVLENRAEGGLRARAILPL